MRRIAAVESTPMTARGPAAAFLALLTVALLLRLFLLVAIPFGQTVSYRLEGLNDEPAHIHYVRYLTERRAFPVQSHHSREPGAFARGDFEYYQPPLYYLVCAPFYAAVGERIGLYACRLVSGVSGLLSLLVLGRILGLLGCSPSCRRLGVIFVALLPTHAYFSSLASNDSLCWLIALLLAHQLLVLLDQGRRPGGVSRRGFDVRLGLLLAAGMLTKSSIGIVLPLLVLAYGHVARRSGQARVALASLIPLGLMLLLAGPWYWRNLALYGSVSAFGVGFGPAEPGLSSAAGLAHTLKATVRYFWFPMQHVPGVPPVVMLRYAGAGILLLHGVAAVAYFRRSGAADVRGIAMALLLASALLGQMILGMSWTDVEGRFLMPALAAIVFLMVAPVMALAARWRGGERLAWIYLCLLAAHPWALLAFA
jgi:4-amino-4-deoxy-L-arabinose transferase-like glycosyltransferase